MKDSLYPMLEIGKRVVTKRFVIFLPLLARKLERLLGLNYPADARRYIVQQTDVLRRAVPFASSVNLRKRLRPSAFSFLLLFVLRLV
jgi:hypothetical protein